MMFEMAKDDSRNLCRSSKEAPGSAAGKWWPYSLKKALQNPIRSLYLPSCCSALTRSSLNGCTADSSVEFVVSFRDLAAIVFERHSTSLRLNMSLVSMRL